MVFRQLCSSDSETPEGPAVDRRLMCFLSCFGRQSLCKRRVDDTSSGGHVLETVGWKMIGIHSRGEGRVKREKTLCGKRDPLGLSRDINCMDLIILEGS